MAERTFTVTSTIKVTIPDDIPEELERNRVVVRSLFGDAQQGAPALDPVEHIKRLHTYFLSGHEHVEALLRQDVLWHCTEMAVPDETLEVSLFVDMLAPILKELPFDTRRFFEGLDDDGWEEYWADLWDRIETRTVEYVIEDEEGRKFRTKLGDEEG